MLDFPLLLPILPFVNFAYCCYPGLLNFHTSCHIQHSPSWGWIVIWDATACTSYHSLWFLPFFQLSTDSQSSLVSQLTEQLEKKKEFQSNPISVCVKPQNPEPDRAVSQCGQLVSSWVGYNHGVTARNRGLEKLWNWELRGNFFPFNTVMPHINLNDSLRMIPWPS